MTKKEIDQLYDILEMSDLRRTIRRKSGKSSYLVDQRYVNVNGKNEWVDMDEWIPGDWEAKNHGSK